jgi:hypothetical protein
MAAIFCEILLPYQGHFALVYISLSTLGNALEPSEQHLVQHKVADLSHVAAIQLSTQE